MKIFKGLLLSLLLVLGCMAPIQSAHATVSSTSNEVIYAGDGVTTVFPFTFNVWNSGSENDLVVSKVVVDTGVVTNLTLTTDYTVALTHAIPSPGSITVLGTPIPTGTSLIILRQLPLTQQVSVADNSATPAATTNQVYDRQVMLAQQLQQQLNRGVFQNPLVTTPIEFPSPLAGYAIGWDADTEELTNIFFGGTGSTIPVPIPNSYLSNLTTAATVSGASFYSLSSIPSGAGVIPAANIPTPFPQGGIIMWSGTIATIPSGWELSDGTCAITCPDLRDKFIVGARQDSAGAAKTNVTGSLTQTGGAATVNLQHNHSGATGPAISGATGGTVLINTALVEHVHSISNDLSTTQSVLNPYYALAFIIKD